MRQVPTLEALPEELKLNICSHLVIEGPDAWEGFYSLCALRQSCKAFACLPTEGIYRHIKLFPSNDSLCAIDSIAQHPVYRHFVSTLDVNSFYLPEYESFASWKETIDGYTNDLDNEYPAETALIQLKRGLQTNDLSAYHNAFLGHLKSKKSFQARSISDLSQLLADRLSCFPNLTRLAFWAAPDWSRSRSQQLDLMERRTLILREADEFEYAWQHANLLQALFMASSATVHDLKVLALQYISIEVFAEDLSTLWGWSLEDEDYTAPVTCKMFETVQTLELLQVSIPTESDESEMPDYDEDHEDDLARFILAFRSLKTLFLSFSNSMCGPVFCETLSNAAPLRHLITLSLHTLRTSEEDILNVLRGQTTTLRDL
jgi:hypothetical protein